MTEHDTSEGRSLPVTLDQLNADQIRQLQHASAAQTMVVPVIPGTPDEQVAHATNVADTLANLVRSRNWSVRIGRGEHLRLEAWSTCGALLGITCATEWVRKDDDNGEWRPPTYEKKGNKWEPVTVGVGGFKARAVLLKNGVQIGAGEAYCTWAEPHWSTREPNQVASMAQTRASSKAFRLVLSWIVVLAGYDPTPYEELDREHTETQRRARPSRPNPPPSEGGDWEQFVDWLTDKFGERADEWAQWAYRDAGLDPAATPYSSTAALALTSRIEAEIARIRETS